ncbi:MAG: hypothetical protein DIZ80_06125 [endosymbiont of Galathealinum brachiosum]|uniref:Uncharacterized protein n=1 Tax=endosymbiont of Galathealinum brachiosum TaxID=2200906 RepID=A0A370DFL1_9GAMM|nr:MAG: hypothetical protein DIZ80_06125 [endosymbiont of Galathealinum brachiosum]
MQISRIYRANQTFLQLKSILLFVLFQSALMCLPGCSPVSTNVKSVNSILPVSDSSNLPEVIKSLLSQSDVQYTKNDLSGALVTLERAIRINPRYAEVWSRMAQVYLKQGDYEQAKQHAKRSNSVIKNNIRLKDFNNQIIIQQSNNIIQEQSGE